MAKKEEKKMYFTDFGATQAAPTVAAVVERVAIAEAAAPLSLWRQAGSARNTRLCWASEARCQY